jgi:homogentisate 1,2-dioxygenase
MLERIVQGKVPRKHHIVFKDDAGKLLYEECFTRTGFEGPYTILYHQHRPHAYRRGEVSHGWTLPKAAPPQPLLRRHYKAGELKPKESMAPVDARVPLLFNNDVVLSSVQPSTPDPIYFSNGDGDELLFIYQGRGLVRSVLGDLRFEQDDYVFLPRGMLYRLIPDAGVPQHWLSIECLGGVHLPQQWRNEVGQLRMDAPYCHRDFRKVEFVAPRDEGIRDLLVKRNGAFHGFRYESPPLDVVGWDGSVYPWVFPILNFQPRAGLVHLPPTWHGTFAARGALICSFVPRTVDFHPEAIPCPYPHSSPDCDEFLFYVRGNFTSRRGVGPASISFHPAGVMHGPHPGAYEKSIGSKETNELAVMLDTFLPLETTAAALSIEDTNYHQSFLE